MQETQKKAYFEPFEKLSGIKVNDFAGSDFTKIKAMVDTSTVEWDLAQVSRGSVLNLQKRGDYFEPIDYDLIDPGVGEDFRFERGLEMLVWAQVMAYRTDAFKGAVPSGWADFWDTKKFPGDRTLVGAGSGNNPELEFALLAAGVPADKLYPLDLDKAFASYDKIKDRRGEVVGNRRGADPDADRQGGRDGQRLERPHGGAAGGRRAGGDKLAAGACEARLLGSAEGREEPRQRNEVHCLLHHAGPAGAAVLADPVRLRQRQIGRVTCPPEQMAILPSAPEIRSQLVPYNYQWWVDNRDTVIDRFNKWLLG